MPYHTHTSLSYSLDQVLEKTLPPKRANERSGKSLCRNLPTAGSKTFMQLATESRIGPTAAAGCPGLARACSVKATGTT